MDPERIRHIAESIPDYQAFLTIDEQHAATRRLAADYPDLVTVETIGQTRRGDPLDLISIRPSADHSGATALVFGGPHPNEPYGCMTIEFLARRLCEDASLRRELGYTWHFIRCLDADGMRLNEGWFHGPFLPTDYYSKMFRPLMPEQPEMNFPIEYKTYKFDRPMPETLALKAAIDRLRPRVMLSLHNAELGGIYYYMSRYCEACMPVFRQIPAWFGVPLDLGESDQAEFVDKYGPATYRTITAKDGYEYMVAHGGLPAVARAESGGTSNEYADELCGTFTLLTEVPLWTEARINDDTPTETARRQVFKESIDRQEAFFTWLKALYEPIEPELRLDTPFRRAVASRIGYYLGRIPGQRRWLETAPDLDRPATVAEALKQRYWKEHENQRLRGMFARMIDAEIEAGNSSPALEDCRKAAASSLQAVGQALEGELRYRFVPIRTAIAIQLSAGLAAAAALADEGN